MYRRPPRGGRGLKSFHIYPLVSRFSRPPRGGRGLKSHIRRHISVIHAMSPPSRGAWIEMRQSGGPGLGALVAPLAGGVD